MHRTSLLSLLVLALVGCTDRGAGVLDPDDPGHGQTGEFEGLSMSYTGAVAGTILVKDVPQQNPDGEWEIQSVAVALRVGEALEISGIEVEGQRASGISLRLTGTAPGVYGIGSDCEPASDQVGCAAGMFIHQVAFEPDGTIDGAYVVVRGTVQLDQVTETGVYGGFSGTAALLEDGEISGDVVEIDDGKFALPQFEYVEPSDGQAGT